MKIKKEDWLICQKYERESWGNNVYLNEQNGELHKQNRYALNMGLINDINNFEIDLDSKSVLDVGCGPISMLLRSNNFKRAVGVEPLFYGEDVFDNYKNKNIDLYNIPAEEMNFKDREFDELWMYNVLQHVYDVSLIIKKIERYSKKIRIFEWIDIPPHDGHPHMLTEDFFVESMNLKKDDYKIVEFSDSLMSGRAIIIEKNYDNN